MDDAWSKIGLGTYSCCMQRMAALPLARIGGKCALNAFDRALMATFLAFALLSPSASGQTAGSWADSTLTAAGFAAGREGAIAFLTSLKTTPEISELTAATIERLGGENFSEREAASLQIVRVRAIDLEMLRQGLDSQNAEIRWRCKKAIEQRQVAAAALLSASLAVIEPSLKSPQRELAWNGTVLAGDRACRANLSRFMASAYQREPKELEKKIKSSDSRVRVVAIDSLHRVMEAKEAAEMVRGMLQDPDPDVRFSVCRVLADVGERNCLRTLANLADSNDPDISSSAVWLLESFTGHFPDSKTIDSNDRKELARYWRQWCEREGATAELKFPVGRAYVARGNLMGGMLFATGSLGTVVLVSQTGEEIWSYAIPAWSAEKLRNGNILIASYDQSEVREVSLDNRVIWRWTRPGARPIRAKPLPNGNVLIADYDGKRVTEIGPSQQLIWEVGLGEENCFDAERLENGNTLVATPSALIEFRPNLERVKTWRIAGRINSVQVLPTGNFLIANHGEGAVMELNREGEILWRYNESGASEVFQTDDGYYLITSDRRSIELSPDRTRVRELRPAAYGSARR